MDIILKGTKNYDEFALYDDNRIITEQSVNKMVATIERKNLLSCFPIVVFLEKGVKYITDGQRRFLASKDGKKEFWYIVNNQCTKEDIPFVNNAGTSWKNEDYLHSFCVKAQNSGSGAFKEYIRLEDFKKTYGFSISNCLIMLCGYDGSDTMGHFKEGELKIGDYPMACKIAEYVLDMKPYHKANWKCKNFVRAMSRVIRNKDYDHGHMVKKLIQRHQYLVYWSSMNQYVLNIQEIYNHRKQKKVIFAKT